MPGVNALLSTKDLTPQVRRAVSDHGLYHEIISQDSVPVSSTVLTVHGTNSDNHGTHQLTAALSQPVLVREIE